MSRRAAYTQADVRRALAELKAAGLTVRGFEKTADGFKLLTDPADAPLLSPDTGEAAWDKAMGKWRRSA